jgi:hypothetical protein
LVQIARQVADLLTPTAPKGISYDFDQNVAASVLADPDKVFRILFNLVSNAQSVAKARRLRSRPWPCDPTGEQTAGGSCGPGHLAGQRDLKVASLACLRGRREAA